MPGHTIQTFESACIKSSGSALQKPIAWLSKFHLRKLWWRTIQIQNNGTAVYSLLHFGKGAAIHVMLIWFSVFFHMTGFTFFSRDHNDDWSKTIAMCICNPFLQTYIALINVCITVHGECCYLYINKVDAFPTWNRQVRSNLIHNLFCIKVVELWGN